MTATESPTESPTGSSTHTFLTGNFAPVDAEVTAWDLTVRGAIPPELSGTYVRNGPNPVAPDPANYHWFIGEGMVHGVHLSEGRAKWYRNRWVRSPRVAKYKGITPVHADEGGFSPGPGNTNIVSHAGSLWALTEGSLPYRLDHSLETLSQENFGGTLPYGINAHPKIDPVTGSMHVMSYHFLEPVIGYHEIDADGHLVRSELLETAKPVMVHDMAMTASRIIAMDLPVVFDMDLAVGGRAMPFRWDDDYVPRIGVMPRSGTAADTVWIEVEPCYVFHPLNAYDDGDTVVLDVARHRTMFRHDLDDDSDGRPQLVRWRLNTATGTSSSELIDDRAQEFPRINERFTGLRHRYGYAAGVGIAQMGGGSGVSSSVFKHDLDTGVATVHEMGPGRSTGEFVFVAASPNSGEPHAGGPHAGEPNTGEPHAGEPHAGEDEGWLMGYVHDAATDRSELVILDATDVAAGPVAVVEVPVRIPAGFHGNWVAS